MSLQMFDGWCRVGVSTITVIPDRPLIGSDAPTRPTILQEAIKAWLATQLRGIKTAQVPLELNK